MTVYSFPTSESMSKSFQNFEQNVLGKEKFLFLGSAKWCGHCQQLKGAWADMKSQLGGNKTKFNIVEFDDTAMQHLQKNHANHPVTNLIAQAVRGYPTVAIVNKANHKNQVEFKVFEGARDASSLVAFAKSQA